MRKLLFAVTLTIFGLAALARPSHAQYGSLQIGTFVAGDPAPCPGSGW